MVVVWSPWMLNSGSTIASTAAMSTGMYSGKHPAITALMAIFSTVATPPSGLMYPISREASRPVAPTIRSTLSGVGGITGKPSDHPPSSMAWNTASGESSERIVVEVRFLTSLKSIFPMLGMYP